MMNTIVLSDIRYATTVCSKGLPKLSVEQLARKLEKYLLREFSVVCEVRV